MIFEFIKICNHNNLHLKLGTKQSDVIEVFKDEVEFDNENNKENWFLALNEASKKIKEKHVK
jgi:hypothetical protein